MVEFKKISYDVVRVGEEFMSVNRAMYMALSGRYVEWTREMTHVWQRYSAMNADLFTEEFDVVVVHDPQPAGIRSFVPESRRSAARWCSPATWTCQAPRRTFGSSFASIFSPMTR